MVSLTQGVPRKTLAQEIILARVPAHGHAGWEKEFHADAFAEELLMPEALVLERFKKVFIQTKYNSPLTVRILAKLFQVEYFNMARRLTRLKAI